MNKYFFSLFYLTPLEKPRAEARVNPACGGCASPHYPPPTGGTSAFSHGVKAPCKILLTGLTLFFCLVSLGTLRGETGEPTNEKEELKDLQKKIEDKKAHIQKTKAEEKKVVSELDRIGKELFQRQKDLKQYEVRLKNQEKEISGVNQKIETLQEELIKKVQQ